MVVVMATDSRLFGTLLMSAHANPLLSRHPTSTIYRLFIYLYILHIYIVMYIYK